MTVYDKANVLSLFGPEMVSQQIDLTHTPLYDTFAITAGNPLTEATSALFSSPIGQSSKTIAQTNLRFANRLQTGEIFAIAAFRIRIAENILFADFYSILNQFAFRFFLGTDKPFQVGPIWMYPAGGGILGTIYDSTASTKSSVLSNGYPSTDAVRNLASPIPIDSSMSFSANLSGAASYTLTAAVSGGFGVTLVCVLDGIYGRLVM